LRPTEAARPAEAAPQEAGAEPENGPRRRRTKAHELYYRSRKAGLTLYVEKKYPKLGSDRKRKKAMKLASREYQSLPADQRQYWATLAGKPPTAKTVDDMSLAELAAGPTAKAKRVPRKVAVQLGLALVTQAKVAGKAKEKVCVTQVAAKCFRHAGFTRRLGKRLLGKCSTLHWLDPKRKPAKMRRGRPAKPTTLNDEAVKQICLAKAVPSCRYRANGEPIYLLPNKSWRKLLLTTPELREQLSYSTLLRRVKRCRLSVTKGKKRTDVCDICKAWDYQVLPKVSGMHKEILEAVCRYCPAYWESFEASVAASPFFADLPPSLRVESAYYWEKLLTYLKGRAGETAHARAGMAAAGREHLEATEARAIKEVEESMLPLVTEWGHHFTLRDDIQGVLQAQYRAPEKGTLYLIYDHKELLTLPIGPAEVGEQWYANARLGVGICGFYLWGESLDERGEWYLYCSRVLEHNSEYTMALVWDLFERIQLKHRDSVVKLVSWADTGPHFRSYKVLASLGVLVPETYKKNIVVNWGPEKHMKGIVDGKFAQVDSAKNDAATRHDIATVAELVRALQEDYDQRKIVDNTLPKETFLEFLPGPREDVVIRDFATPKAAHGGIGIKACYSWEFSLINRRRASVFGRGAHENTATNLKAYCRVLPGRAEATDVCFTPVLAPLGAAPAGRPEDDDDDAPGDVEPGAPAVDGAPAEPGAPAAAAAPAVFVEAPGDAPEEAKLINGWRVSYRTTAPEKQPYTKFRRRLQQRTRWIEKAKSELTASRRKPQDTLRAASARTATLKAARAKRTAAALKLMRKPRKQD